MDLANLIIVQKYVVVSLFFVSSLLCYRIQNKGISDLFVNWRIILIIIMFGLPFFFGIAHFVPQEYTEVLQAGLKFVLSFTFLVLVSKGYSSTKDGRRAELRELIRKPENPLKAEFVREFVQPEIKMIKKKAKKLKKLEKSVDKKQQDLDSKIKLFYDKDNELKDKLKLIDDEKKELKAKYKEVMSKQNNLEDLNDNLELKKNKIEKSMEKLEEQKLKNTFK